MLREKDWKLEGTDWEKYVTSYTDSETAVKGRLLYFHGGGLLYGSRNDLPRGHIDLLTRAGYEILAFDYPLAPAADLELILADVCASVNSSCEGGAAFTDSSLPYFLWGRSAGAYLCLIAAASGRLRKKSAGILSYYGYGLLCDGWLCAPSAYYLRLPRMDESCLRHIPQGIHADGGLDSHYGIYVYARQSGSWRSLIYKGREKFFYLDYSLRACGQLPCPLFAAHSTGDEDVPYSEFLALCSRYQAERFIVPGSGHDFDRDPDSPFTAALLEATVQFLNENVG